MAKHSVPSSNSCHGYLLNSSKSFIVADTAEISYLSVKITRFYGFPETVTFVFHYFCGVLHHVFQSVGYCKYCVTAI